MQQVLITDSLFILPEHEAKIKAAGYAIERLDKSEATEEELAKAIQGKVGYILGGTEKITENVLHTAPDLRAIVFTGTGWQAFIPAHDYATRYGIAIGAAPNLNAYAVAEWALAATLMRSRYMLELARGQHKIFMTTVSLKDQSVGIVGLGHVGESYVRMLYGLGVTNLQYYSRTRKPVLEHELSLMFVDKKELLKSCDVIFIALPIGAGDGYFDATCINSIKRGALLVTVSEPLLFDHDSLYTRLECGDIRAAFDENIQEPRFQNLPLNTWYTSNVSTAYNTAGTISDISESATDTLLNLLHSGNDHFLMNPEYRKYVR